MATFIKDDAAIEMIVDESNETFGRMYRSLVNAWIRFVGKCSDSCTPQQMRLLQSYCPYGFAEIALRYCFRTHAILMSEHTLLLSNPDEPTDDEVYEPIFGYSDTVIDNALVNPLIKETSKIFIKEEDYIKGYIEAEFPLYLAGTKYAYRVIELGDVSGTYDNPVFTFLTYELADAEIFEEELETNVKR